MRAPRKARVSPDGDEADVVAVRLLGDRQTAAGRLGADLRLGGVPDRERGVTQLSGGQHREHVRLVFVGVDGAAQPPVREPGVVAGGDSVKPQRQRASGQRGELDSLVAAHTRVGGFAAGIGRHEVVDDVFFEPVREIPDIEGDSEHIRDPSGIAGVFLGAAAARAGAQSARGVR